MSAQLHPTFDLIVESVRPTPGKTTHAGFWTSEIRKALRDRVEIGDCHYDCSGMVSYFTDPADGQTYRVHISPMKS